MRTGRCPLLRTSPAPAGIKHSAAAAAVPRSGFGAEVAATIAQQCFLRLEAPPARVCGMDTPFPLVYEPLYLPGVQRVVDGVRQSLSF
jgi:pyruvate/2-oxoglutarate/acetoin dehydrogenase E1 component